MINYAWLCKWVKSLPKMLPTAQISAFSLTCNNNNNKNEPKILSFFPFGKARYCYYSVSIKTQEDLGQSELGGSHWSVWVELSEELGGKVCEAVLSVRQSCCQSSSQSFSPHEYSSLHQWKWKVKLSKTQSWKLILFSHFELLQNVYKVKCRILKHCFSLKLSSSSLA